MKHIANGIGYTQHVQPLHIISNQVSSRSLKKIIEVEHIKDFVYMTHKQTIRSDNKDNKIWDKNHFQLYPLIYYLTSVVPKNPDAVVWWRDTMKSTYPVCYSRKIGWFHQDSHTTRDLEHISMSMSFCKGNSEHVCKEKVITDIKKKHWHQAVYQWKIVILTDSIKKKIVKTEMWGSHKREITTYMMLPKQQLQLVSNYQPDFMVLLDTFSASALILQALCLHFC